MLQSDGILVIRGLIPPPEVADAREDVLACMKSSGSDSLLNRVDIQNRPKVISVLEHPKLKNYIRENLAGYFLNSNYVKRIRNRSRSPRRKGRIRKAPDDRNCAEY